MAKSSQAQIMEEGEEREKLRRKSDCFLRKLDNLREKVHLAEGVEKSLELVLWGLEEWGYSFPRIYRHAGDEEYTHIKGHLPERAKQKKISFNVSSNKLLEEILQSDSVYYRKKIPSSLIGREEDPLFHILKEKPEAQGIIGVPYIGFSKTYTEKVIKGIIIANYDPPTKTIDEHEIEALEKLGWLVGDKVIRLLENKLLEKKKRELEVRAKKDSLLADLWNKNTFHEDLEGYLKEVKEESKPYYLIMVDCDGLKELNDRKGHPAGDAFLKRLGTYLASLNDKTVATYRIGGDEFALLVGTSSQDYVLNLAEKIRNQIKMITTAGKPITASLGLVQASSKFSDGEEWYKIADEALYYAKGCQNKLLRSLIGGGDRLVLYQEKNFLIKGRDNLKTNLAMEVMNIKSKIEKIFWSIYK